jgi:hypothetical protein
MSMMGSNTYVNAHCHQREVEYRQNIHKQRLKGMQSISKSKNPFQKVQLDLDPPTKPAFLRENRSKKEQQAQRIREIEHDNHILLTKMADIMMPRRSDQLREFRPGVRLTPSGAPVIDNFVSTTNALASSTVGKGKDGKGGKKPQASSLGGLARKREMEKVITENLAMLDRINKSKTSYSKQRMNRDFADSRVYRNLCSVNTTAGHLPAPRPGHLPSLRPQSSPTNNGGGGRGAASPGRGGGGGSSDATTLLAFEKRTPLASSDGAVHNYIVKVFAYTSEENPLVQITLETRRDTSGSREGENAANGDSGPGREGGGETEGETNSGKGGDSGSGQAEGADGAEAQPTGSGEEGGDEATTREKQQEQKTQDGEEKKEEEEELPLLLTIKSAELKFFVPVARRQRFFQRDNMPELFDFLLSRLEVARLDDGQRFLHLSPCSTDERVVVGLEPIIVHRTTVEVPVRSMATDAAPTGACWLACLLGFLFGLRMLMHLY